jgi:hypothetical protein
LLYSSTGRSKSASLLKEEAMKKKARVIHPPAAPRALVAMCALVLCLVTSAAAQYPVPVNPVPSVPATGVTSLVGIGSVAPIGTTGFRLTPSAPYQRGAVWLINKQFVATGFQSTFQFRISDPRGLIQSTPFGIQQGGDGFAFVVQNFGIPVVGPPAGFLGYHGIPNSLAIEFDTWLNYEPGFFDPNGNHVSVHSRGLMANSVSESASLGWTTAIPFLKDGAVHLAQINYVPGSLQIFVDNLAVPALTVPGLDLSSLLRLDNGTAWMGFTAGTGSAYEAHDILSWQFGGTGSAVPGGGPFPVTTTPPPTGTTQPPFTFPPYP